jgi:ABC-2 type transport system permease protein
MSAFFVVVRKELQDYFNSWRFVLTFVVIISSVVYGMYAIGMLKNSLTGAAPVASSDVFLSVLTTQSFNVTTSLVPSSFLLLMATVLPLIAIILGMDAINGEKNNGTLSRLVSQPIYRDNIINAKFLSGIVIIGITLLCSTLLVLAMGLLRLGVPPSSEEILRVILFLIVGVIYGGFWLGLAILCSTLFKQVAASAVVAIAIWIFFAFFFPLIYESVASGAQTIADFQRIIMIGRISPIYLFEESMGVVLYPTARSVSQIIMLASTDAGNYMMQSPLTIWQSFIAVWPQIILTVVLTIVFFVGSYIKFMFEEVRSF